MDKKEFLNPPAIYRPAPFWSWNDRLDGGELERQIDEMARKGWGGYFMHSRVGLVTGYLSDEWMEMIRTCTKKARETGTYAWLYDEDKWPSGFAGGEVPEMDESYRSRALVLLKENEKTENDELISRVSYKGEEFIICKRISSLSNPWFNGTCYVDLMNPEAVKAFINCTHERYKETCGEYFGKEIPGMFTDEPCYLMYSHYNVPAIPWSDCLPGYFEELKGYRIENHVDELFFNIGNYKKTRYDFYECATRLFIESFTEQYFRWCDENGLIMTGHYAAEDTLVEQTRWIGAAMPHYEYMHWPGIDKLGRHIEQLVAVKQVSSVVDQLEKERSFSEVFGCIGQHANFFHRKWIADWQAALGISFVNHHLSLYSMRGERKRDYPANLFYQQPWWEEEKEFGDYIGRLSYAVSKGKRKVDILVVHPMGSVWSEYSPLNKKNNFMVEKNLYDIPFERLSKSLAANKLDFHYGDEFLMEKHAKVENGKLVIGSASYSTVIVPPCCTLRKTTLKLLDEFIESAGPGRVIFVSDYPEMIDGVRAEIGIPDKAMKLSSIDEVIEKLDGYYPGRVKVYNKITGKNAEKVFCHAREIDGGEIIFLANTDEKSEVAAEIHIPNAKNLIIMDLLTGNRYHCPVRYSDETGIVDAIFYPAGSMLLLNVLDNEGSSDDEDKMECPDILDSGIEFHSSGGILDTIENWRTTLLEDNVLPLKTVTLELDGRTVLENEPIEKAWHGHFYKAPDGTPFKAEYTFEVLDEEIGEIFAAVECAENLDRITLNRHPVKPLKEKGELGAFNSDKSWKDINFTKVPLDGLLRKGRNTLAIEGRKVNNITGPGCHIRVADFKNHMPTEVETIYIVGDFKVVDVDRECFAIGKRSGAIDPQNLTASGYPFYSGSAAFTGQFDYNGPVRTVYLSINDVNAACIGVEVNGQKVSTKYWRPYVFDITDCLVEGTNTVKVVASTTLFNIMGPNNISGIAEVTFVSPRTFVYFDKYTKRYELMPFGIGRGIITLSNE